MYFKTKQLINVLNLSRTVHEMFPSFEHHVGLIDSDAAV